MLTGACQFGHGVGGFATNFIHSPPPKQGLSTKQRLIHHHNLRVIPPPPNQGLSTKQRLSAGKLLRKARSLSGGATGHWSEHQSTHSNFRSFAGHRTTPTTNATPPANHTPPAVLLVGLRRCQWNSPLARVRMLYRPLQHRSRWRYSERPTLRTIELHLGSVGTGVPDSYARRCS